MWWVIPVIMLPVIAGCGKKRLPYSAIPEISIQKVEPTTLHEYVDSLVVEVHYQDGDGDLGFTNPDSASLWVKDARLQNPDWYFVKPLAPPDANIPIEGNVRFRLRGTFIFGNGSQESTYFTLKLKDRAGHWSNEVKTPEITIVK